MIYVLFIILLALVLAFAYTLGKAKGSTRSFMDTAKALWKSLTHKTSVTESILASGTAMSFGGALVMLKEGKGVRRAGWNGTGLTVRLQKPDAGSANTEPYLYMTFPADHPVYPNGRVPWLASHLDVLAEDWLIVE